MKVQQTISFLIILITIPVIVFAWDNDNSVDEVRLGVSHINITPDKPTMMSGYGARKTPFTGIHDSIYASAFYFVGENTQNFLITADLIGFSFDFVNEMRGLISSRTNIPAKNIMLVAVHNHGGPSLGEYGNELVMEYTKELKKKLVDLAVNSTLLVVPFKIGMGKGSCDLNINRRAEFTKGEIWLGRNSSGACDHELDVVKFESLDDKILAVLINWPCHGTATGDSNYLITGDWSGSAARYVREQVGGDVAIGVTAGASGDINPIYGPGNVFREVDAIGYHVGDETINLLSTIETYPVKTLVQMDTTLTFPGKKYCEDHLPYATYERGPDTKITLSALKIGTLVLAGISGELFTEIGMQVKKLSPFSETVILTHCNGSSGYIPTDEAYSKGGYEIQVTKLLPGIEKTLVKDFVGLIHSLD